MPAGQGGVRALEVVGLIEAAEVVTRAEGVWDGFVAAIALRGEGGMGRGW